MSVPQLRLRKDIWAHFPVNVDSMGRGANGADRHCIEWHNLKVQQIAQAEGKTPDQVKKDLLPRLIGALSASRAWTVVAPEPGSKCVAVIAMRFAANTRKANTRVGNITRKANNKGNKTMEWRRSPKSPKKANKPNNTQKSAKKSANRTQKAPKNLSDLTGDALQKKAMGILNKMSEASFDRLSAEFLSLKPKTVSDFERLVQVIVDLGMDQQAYHPLLIRLLHLLETRNTTESPEARIVPAVVAKLLTRVLQEPVFAKMEVEAEEVSPNKNHEEKVLLQKRFFRSVTLLTGFLYRDGFLGWSDFQKVLQQFASTVFEIDPADVDYRIYDASAQGLLYMLIRAGARLQTEQSTYFSSMLTKIGQLAKEAKRGLVRTDATEFLDAVQNGFLIKPNMTWTVGAPTTDIKRKSPMGPKEPIIQKEQPGLGVDISEIWRRFPLDVKQVGDIYEVRFHNKKLQERHQKETKFRRVEDLQAALSQQILSLVEHSKYWKKGPVVPGTFLTIQKK